MKIKYRIVAITGLLKAALFVAVLTGKIFLSVSIAQNCTGSTLGAYSVSPIQFLTYNDLLNGGTASQYISAQFNVGAGSNCPHWKLTAKATGNFTNGSRQLDLRYTSIQFNTIVSGPPSSSIGIPPNAFPLSLNEVVIIPNSNEPLDNRKYPYFEIKYDLIIQGGNQLLGLNNGEYYTNIVFCLYDQNGNLVSSATTKIAFQVYYSANGANLQLLNGANNIVLRFTNASDIENGVTSIIPGGLSVVAYSSHQLIVKAATSNMIATGTLNSIPVSTIRLTLKAPSSFSNIICYSLPLSAAGQVYADNPMSDYTYQTVLYDLTYAIAGKDPAISAAPVGTYVTNVVFIVVPK